MALGRAAFPTVAPRLEARRRGNEEGAEIAARNRSECGVDGADRRGRHDTAPVKKPVMFAVVKIAVVILASATPIELRKRRARSVRTKHD